MTVNFSLLALDQILNTAATLRHMSGGQFGVPLVIRMATGAGKQLAAQHSHSLEGWYAHIPGLRMLAPATLEDARGMLWTALEDPDPVLIFENVMLYNMTGKLDARCRAGGHRRRPRSGAQGDDLTLHHLWRVAVQDAGGGRGAGRGRHRGRGDRPALLRPLDDATIMASVARTRRARDRGRGLAQRVACRPRSRRGSCEQAFWSPRRAGGARLPRRGADPISGASGTGRDPAVARDRRRGAGRCWGRSEPWACS